MGAMPCKRIPFATLPESPGVYVFRKSDGTALYIGKATSLRDRIRSYFRSDVPRSRGPKITAMLEEAEKIDVYPTDSVLEALILEAKWIKAQHPPYNTRDKDDKSFHFIAISREAFPRVTVLRGRDLLKKRPALSLRELYGPFPNGGQLQTAMRILRRLFPFRDRCKPGQKKPCFHRQLGLCPGVCSGEIGAMAYRRGIRALELFLSGKKGEVLTLLKRDMAKAAEALEFEEAARIKKTLASLTHIQDMALLAGDREAVLPEDSATARIATPFRIEAYDIAHLGGCASVGAMTVVEDGIPQKGEYRRFQIKTVEGVSDTACLEEILRRRLAHRQWRLPQIIAVDGSTAQRNAALRVLKEANCKIPVVGVVKDERHRPKALLGPQKIIQGHEKYILLSNHEAHRFAIAYHRGLRARKWRDSSPS